MTIGTQIAAARARARLSQKELGERCGVSASAVTQWERDKTTPTLAALKALSLACDVNVSDILEGYLNLSEVPMRRGRVPLIAATQAGGWREIVDPYAPGLAEEWVEVTVPVRPHTFALRVDGDSMETRFPAGIIIIVEPDLAPKNGDFVVARWNGQSTFKQLVIDGGMVLLKQLNPRYPILPMPEGGEVVGVVRQALMTFA